MKPKQAPKRIFLQNDDYDHASWDSASWCEDSINDGDVEYIRADLAAPAEPDHLPPHLLPFTDQTCWQQRDDLVREALDLLEKNKALEASIRQVAETRDIHFRRVQELEAAASRPTPSLAAAPEVDPETCTHQNTELVCLDCCHSPAAPSGVVEALAQQLARDIDACLTSTQIAERALALLATPLPQSPATPAAAPVDQEAENGRAALAWMRAQAKAIDSSVTDDWGPFYLSRVIASRVNAQAPAPGSHGVEAPRKGARQWLDSCQTCKVSFPKGGYHNCPAVREACEGEKP